MSNLSDETSKLEAKIKKLIHLHRELQQDYSKLKFDNEQLKTTIHKQQDQIMQLEEGNKALQLAKSLISTDGNPKSGEMKSKFNEVIRDIDSCLELLNK